MTFQKEKNHEFITLFNRKKNEIRNFEGCESVILYQDTRKENVFFTISKWKDLDALELYRTSSLFRETWAKTKSMFEEKAEAWSLNQILQAQEISD